MSDLNIEPLEALACILAVLGLGILYIYPTSVLGLISLTVGIFIGTVL